MTPLTIPMVTVHHTVIVSCFLFLSLLAVQRTEGVLIYFNILVSCRFITRPWYMQLKCIIWSLSIFVCVYIYIYMESIMYIYMYTVIPVNLEQWVLASIEYLILRISLILLGFVKTHKELFPLSSNICTSKAWSISFVCAKQFHCNQSIKAHMHKSQFRSPSVRTSQ